MQYNIDVRCEVFRFPEGRFFVIQHFEPPLENLLFEYGDLLQKIRRANSIDDETLHEIAAVAAKLDACACVICYERGSLVRWLAAKLKRASVKPEPEAQPLIEYADLLESGVLHPDTCRQARIAYLETSYRGLQREKKSIEKSLLHPNLKQPFAELVDLVLRSHPVHTAGDLEEYDDLALSFWVVWDWWTHRLLFWQWYDEESSCIDALDRVQMRLWELIGEDPAPPAVYLAAVDALEVEPETFKRTFHDALNNYMQMDRLASKAKAEYEIYSPKDSATGKRHKWRVLLESDLWKEHHPDPLGSMHSKVDVEQIVAERDSVNRLIAQACRDEVDRNIVALRLQDPNLDLSDIAEILSKPHDLIRQRWSRLRRRASKLFSA